jgi:predicted nuclease of predicted toxin-antitoxin system
LKFLIDAQLPRRMCGWLRDSGHEATHTLDLALGNRTPDRVLVEQADSSGCVLVTKDADFVQSRLLKGAPRQLWLIVTGNVGNRELEGLVRRALPQVVRALGSAGFVELGRTHLSIRG